MSNRPPTPPREWQPLGRARRLIDAAKRAQLLAAAEQLGATAEQINAMLDEDVETWMNDLVTVTVERDDNGDVNHLSIRRNDRKPLRDWRVLQRIKNEIAGAEVEAVELYPAESRLVDTANQYHLWVLPPGKRVAFGWGNRLVSGAELAAQVGGQQREPS